MPPKRKASAAGSGRSSKRAVSGAATPQSVGSSDEYSQSGEEASENEVETITKALSNFATPAMQSHKSGLSDLSYLALKPDHHNRPLYIDAKKARITLESFHPLAKMAADLLVTIAEPLSRPKNLHEYALTVHSLYAAVSVGLTPQDILNGLNKFLKTPLPDEIKDFVLRATRAFGKVKLVLKNNFYFLETTDPAVLQELMQDEEIANVVSENQGAIITEAAPKEGTVVIPGTKMAAGLRQGGVSSQDQAGITQDSNSKEDDFLTALRAEDDDDEEEEQKQIFSKEIPSDAVETVQKRCLDMQYPVLEEYDFSNDKDNPTLDVDLKPGTKVHTSSPIFVETSSQTYHNDTDPRLPRESIVQNVWQRPRKKRNHRASMWSWKDSSGHHSRMHCAERHNRMLKIHGQRTPTKPP